MFETAREARLRFDDRGGWELTVQDHPLVVRPSTILADGREPDGQPTDVLAGDDLLDALHRSSDSSTGSGASVNVCRRDLLAATGGLMLIDTLAASEPVRWTWRLQTPAPPTLALHARRIDLRDGPAAARLYLLAPEGIRTGLDALDASHRLQIETNQRTRAARFVVCLLLHEPDAPPVPQRFQDETQLGLRWRSPAGERILVARRGEAGPRETAGWPWSGEGAVIDPSAGVLIDAVSGR